MFRSGDQVLYGIHGVCNIIAVECKKIGGKPAEYYVLEPVDQVGTRFYVPTQNKTAVAKLRPILTQQELNDMLCSADVRNTVWIEDENQRKQRYSSLITGGDRAALVGMVHAIHKHKSQQAAAGRKLHLCDENFLRDAQRILGAEFSIVLNIGNHEVGKYVQDILGAEQKGSGT